jgi:hypothetical protein
VQGGPAVVLGAVHSSIIGFNRCVSYSDSGFNRCVSYRDSGFNRCVSYRDSGFNTIHVSTCPLLLRVVGGNSLPQRPPLCYRGVYVYVYVYVYVICV